MSRYCADLFEKFEEIWLTSFFDYLPVSESIDVECLNGDFLSRWWHAKEGTLMRTPHGKASSHFVIFRYQLFQSPLNVWESGSHHLNDFQITRRPADGFSSAGYIEACFG